MSLLLRAVAWHRGTSAALLLTAVLAVAAAVCGPVWGRAAEDSLVRDALAAAPVQRTGYVVSVPANRPTVLDEVRPPATALSDAVEGTLLPGALGARLDEPRRQLTTTRRLSLTRVPTEAEVAAAAAAAERGGEGTALDEPPRGLGRLAWREGACERLELLAGSCPAAVDEVLLSDRALASLGARVGDRVRMLELAEEPDPAGQRDPFRTDYRVSGAYEAAAVDPQDPWWFGSGLFEHAPAAVFAGEPVPARLDGVMATRELLVSLQTSTVVATAERALRPGALPLAEVDATAGALEAAARTGNATGAGTVHDAGLAATLRAVEDDRERVRTGALLVSGQVVLLGWYVLLGVVGVAVAAREPETALAKLRGLPPYRAAWLALAPPLLLVALALPLGTGLALLVATRLRDAVLAPGTPLDLGAPALAAAGVAALGAVVAAVVASWRSLRAPVAEQLRRSGGAAERRQGRTAVVAVVAVAGAAASLVAALGEAASGSAVALLMPVLVGLAAGLLAAALLGWGASRAVRRSARSPLPRFLAVRQLARRPGTTRATALVTATVTFVGFAAAAWVVAREQRATEARVAVGADRVVTVDPVPAAELLDAVRAADPDGRAAMAAVQVAGEGETGTRRLLAVDTTRWASVVEGPAAGALDGGAAAELARSDGATSLEVRGVRWEAELELDQVETAVPLALLGAATTLEGVPVPAAFGRLVEGRQRVVAQVPSCRAGCRVSQLRLVRAGGVGGVVGSARLLSLSVDGTVVERFDVDDWRPTTVDEELPGSSPTTDLVEAPGGGIDVSFAVSPSVTPGIARRDVPPVLSGVVGSATAVRYVGAEGLVIGSSLGEAVPNLRVVRVAEVLPRLGPEGLLVDLAVAERFAPARRAAVVHQVWLSDEAGPGVLDALRGEGLVVRGEETVAERRDALDAGGTALALLLLLVAAAVVLLTGLAGVATSLAAQARRRAFEAAALRAVAVPEAVLRRAAAWELGLLLVPALVLGTACAGGALLVAADLLPSLTGASGTAATLPAAARVWLPVLAASLLAACCLALLVAVSARGSSPAARARRLREGQA
ncbi:hypothetical protein [Vallicoccus soli]|uniref:hypothetical protein n=1 Tax=Vallicoccus soli TaxID=2339232 RepID=UPI00105A35AB|nr:hypothetical protein [Vallicoccus soli]